MSLLLGLFAGAALVINEVCYDPPGADAGAEFVEIFNPDSLTVSLVGWRLEFANGAGTVHWETRWAGTAAHAVAPHHVFLIADTGWSGPVADVTTTLALQNGPDAIRLVHPDGSIDTVGWGDLDASTLFEGAPSPDVAGLALARRPDGQDTQNNASDFHAVDPTPGSLNWPAFAPRLEALTWQPPVAAGAGAPIQAQVAVRNAGRLDLAGSRLRLVLGDAVAMTVLGAAAAESVRAATLTLTAPRDGRLPAALTIWSPATAESLHWDLGGVQSGAAALRIAEVMAAPTAGGEWVEIVNMDVVPRSLVDLSLRDEDGAWRRLPDLVLPPGDCRLLAQDADELAAWLADLLAAGTALPCQPAPPVLLPGWPTLNNTAPATRDHADRFYLADADGTVIDFVTVGLGSGRAPAGRSLERGSDGHWRPATAAAGATPGCSPPPPPPVAVGDIRLEPNPFARDRGDGAVHAHLMVSPPATGYELQIYDLWGRLVRDLGGDDLGPGTREAIWDGHDEDGEPLPAGGYVMMVRWRGAGAGIATPRRLLVVIRESDQ